MDIIFQYILDHYGIAAVLVCIIVLIKYKDLAKRVENLEIAHAADSKELVQIAKDVSFIRGRLEKQYEN